MTGIHHDRESLRAGRYSDPKTFRKRAFEAMRIRGGSCGRQGSQIQNRILFTS